MGGACGRPPNLFARACACACVPVHVHVLELLLVLVVLDTARACACAVDHRSPAGGFSMCQDGVGNKCDKYVVSLLCMRVRAPFHECSALDLPGGCKHCVPLVLSVVVCAVCVLFV